MRNPAHYGFSILAASTFFAQRFVSSSANAPGKAFAPCVSGLRIAINIIAIYPYIQRATVLKDSFFGDLQGFAEIGGAIRATSKVASA